MKYTKRRKYKYTVYQQEVIELDYYTDAESILADQVLYPLEGEIKLKTKYIELDMLNRRLIIKPGYAWDGVSAGFNTKTNKRASLAHDALYQLIREGLLPLELKDWADRSFRQICIEDGMCEFRANYSYQAVKRFGAKHCDPANHILTAP